MSLESKICSVCANEHAEELNYEVEFFMGFCDWCEERTLVADSYFFYQS